MSTKALRALIEWAEHGDSPHAAEARRELAAIENGAETVRDCMTVLEPYRKSDSVKSARWLFSLIADEKRGRN